MLHLSYGKSSIFRVLREEKGYTYGAGSGLQSDNRTDAMKSGATAIPQPGTVLQLSTSSGHEFGCTVTRAEFDALVEGGQADNVKSILRALPS